ncbi:MAG: hypothetical protein AB1626_01260 [Candidatus Micrarchaeota archaeon]
MNKTFAIAAVLLATLLVAGCTSQAQPSVATPTPSGLAAATAPAATPVPTMAVAAGDSAVSQEDLDALRQDIEGRQYDDLQGLS